MTPVLIGRWQTRLFLMTVLGVPVTAIFAVIFKDIRTLFLLLASVLMLGFGWDVLYDHLQHRRWERDWPPLLFALSAMVEGVTVWLLIKATFLWGTLGLKTVPGVNPDLRLVHYVAHYLSVWFITFAFMLGPIKVCFPRWRYNGARLVQRRKTL